MLLVEAVHHQHLWLKMLSSDQEQIVDEVKLNADIPSDSSSSSRLLSGTRPPSQPHSVNSSARHKNVFIEDVKVMRRRHDSASE